MKKAMSAVKSIEITRAVRSTKFGELKIKKKQPIGILDGDLIAVGKTTLDVLNQGLAKLDLDKVEVITIYYGADTKPEEAEEVSSRIREQYPRLQIEVVRGGQPHYDYIVSVE
jgi:dihydroxyacetone kinase-like predicted kinase